MPWFNWRSINLHKFKMIPKRNSKLVWGSSLFVGGILYLKVWLPVIKIGVPCVFHELTGFYCPGCGITRAAVSLLQLDFHQAYRYNSLLLFLLPLYITYALATKKQMRRTSNLIMSVMLTLTISFGILRNVPVFHWLAPTEIG